MKNGSYSGVFGLVAKGLMAYLLPNTKKKLAFALVAQQILYATTSAMVFPTAEEYLLSKGYAPELVERLGDYGKFRIRSPIEEASLVEKLQLLTSAPFLPGMLAVSYRYATDDMAGGAAWPAAFTQHCQIVFSDKMVTQERSVFNAYRYFDVKLPEGEPRKLDYKLQATETLAHEGEHCSLPLWRHVFNRIVLGGIQSEMLEEARADIASIDIFKGHESADDVAKFLKAYRIVDRSSDYYFIDNFTAEHQQSHDTALFIDAHLRGEPAPDVEDVMRSNYELYDAVMSDDDGYVHDLHELTKEGATFYITRRIHNILGDKNVDKILSPLAKRRAELFLEAIEHFAPQYYKRAVCSSLTAQEQADYPHFAIKKLPALCHEG